MCSGKTGTKFGFTFATNAFVYRQCGGLADACQSESPRDRRDEIRTGSADKRSAMPRGRVRLIVWCTECEHQVEPDPAAMAGRYGAETTVPDWRERLVCSKRDSRDIDMVVTGTERRQGGANRNGPQRSLVSGPEVGSGWIADLRQWSRRFRPLASQPFKPRASTLCRHSAGAQITNFASEPFSR
jgi:hypothetical protein